MPSKSEPPAAAEAKDDLTPLAHCTLDQIGDELEKRTKAYIFAYLAEERGKKEGADDIWQGFCRGGKVVALGLARALAGTLEHELSGQVIAQDVAEAEEGEGDSDA